MGISELFSKVAGYAQSNADVVRLKFPVSADHKHLDAKKRTN